MTEKARIAEHPAPHRARARLPLLLGAAILGPLVWFLQLNAGYGLAANACYPNFAPLRWPAFSWDKPLAWAFNGSAIALALVAAAMAHRAWRATREEKAGEAEAALAVGEGRTRFLALWGMMTGLGFLLATLFTTVVLALVPQCSG